MHLKVVFQTLKMHQTAMQTTRVQQDQANLILEMTAVMAKKVRTRPIPVAAEAGSVVIMAASQTMHPFLPSRSQSEMHFQSACYRSLYAS